MISDLLQIALRDPAVYDELSADGVRPREHWAPLVQTLEALGVDELDHRLARAERQIRENGVTYNIYGDPQGANRPWRIDLIPFVIPASEWRVIEAGVQQRAQLLNLLLKDLYGPQKLLHNGSIPAALLYANPAFLRPVTGIAVPDASRLHLYAVDLARSPDGQWWILADRTQAPSGAGYAFENRTIVADLFPDLFRDSDILRLARFYRTQREALVRLSKRDNPRVVLLTPGPLNETYFEHSFLARHWGFTLVEGGDLTVRDRHLYLKTVAGLEPVDVVLRRVDDSFCDPLELRADSFLGVAGLVEAVAAGNVQIANSLGSGVIETAGMMPFLPGLCRQLLGEPLKLPSVATWWCGQEYALELALENFNQVVFKPAYPSRPMEPVFGSALTKAEKQKMIEQVRARPHEFVAQEQVALSTAPVWDNGRIFHRSVVLRAYAVNTGHDWMVLPGGLVRVAGSDTQVVSMQRGGHSKDAWVLWDGPVDTTYTLASGRTEPVEIRRTGADLPSRAADDLFWLGRYVERAECKARLLRTLVSRMHRATASEFGLLLRLHATLDSDHSTLPTETVPTVTELETEIVSLMTDTRRPDSLASILAEVHRVGGNVRERLSRDLIRLISQLVESIQIEDYMLLVEYSALLTGCLELLSAFSGMERENMTRGLGWLFLSLGRRLERAVVLTEQLQSVAAPMSQAELPLLEYLLEVGDSSITYRSRYYTALQQIPVLDVLWMDESNPRSLAFQLNHLTDLYGKLPRPQTSDLRAIQYACRRMQSIDLRKLSREPDSAHEAHRSLEELGELLESWGDNLANTYFSHARILPITIGE